MTLLSRLSAVLVALTIFAGVSGPAMAEKKILDVIVASSNTGNNWKQGVMLQKALTERGYDSKLVHTANCFKNKKYIAGTDRPGFYFKSGSSWISDVVRKKCFIAPEVTKDVSYVTPFFYRSNAMCVRKSDNIGSDLKDIMAWIKAKDRVTIGTFNNLPDDFADLGKQFGNKWKKVAYNGSSNTLKGFLAGDTDLMYLGYTAREINTPDLNCFATTGGVNGTAKFADIFPNWGLSSLVEFPVVFGIKLNEAQKADAKAVIGDMMSNDPDLKKYYGTAFIPTSAELEKRGLGLEDWWKDAADWMPGGVKSDTVANWKAGKLQ